MARTAEATIASKRRQAADRRRRTDDAEMEWEGQVQVRYGLDRGHPWDGGVYSPYLPCQENAGRSYYVVRLSQKQISSAK